MPVESNGAIGKRKPADTLPSMEQAQANNSGHNQVERDNVVEQPGDDQNENACDQGDDRLEMRDGEGHVRCPGCCRKAEEVALILVLFGSNVIFSRENAAGDRLGIYLSDAVAPQRFHPGTSLGKCPRHDRNARKKLTIQLHASC